MFYIKSDDMDDLFKKAAENCDLNDDLAADWNKVHAALEKEESLEDSTETKKKRRRFIFFWWWLFIPVAIVISYSIGLFNGETVQQKQQTISSSSIKKTNETKQSNQKKDEHLKVDADKNNVSNIKDLNKPATAYVQPNVALSQISEKNKRQESLPKIQTFIAGEKIQNNTKNITDGSNSSEMSALINNNASEIIPKQLTNVLAKDSILPAIKKDSILKNVTNVNATAKDQNSSGKKTKKNIFDFTRQAYWVIGITTNTDLSFVKNQQASKVGYGGGIVAGYHLKNGLSIQTGLSLDRKNYYTSGKYFDTKRLPYFQSSDVTLNYANGNCNMWEIPLNISYDFKGGNKINLFVTAGVSSYLMQNEYYNFNYNLNRYAYDSGFNYPRSSKDYFSIMNLGAGANLQAGKNLFIQVQPYFKVPLKGVGIGNLSLKSAGLNISVVKHIH